MPPAKTSTPEDFIRMTKGITMATAKAVAAGNSCRQEDVIATANLSRRAIADMLRSCKVGPGVISQEGGHGQEQWGVQRGGRHLIMQSLDEQPGGVAGEGWQGHPLKQCSCNPPPGSRSCSWAARGGRGQPSPFCVGLAIICPSPSRKLHAIQMWAVKCGTEPCALARSVLAATWSFWNTSSW